MSDDIRLIWNLKNGFTDRNYCFYPEQKLLVVINRMNDNITTEMGLNRNLSNGREGGEEEI